MIYLLGKGTAQKGSDDRRDTHDGSKTRRPGRSLGKRNDVEHDNDGPIDHARRSQTRDGATDDKACGRGRGTGHGRSELEDADGGHEHPFWRIEGIDAAVEEEKGTEGEHVRTSIPATRSVPVQVSREVQLSQLTSPHPQKNGDHP